MSDSRGSPLSHPTFLMSHLKARSNIEPFLGRDACNPLEARPGQSVVPPHPAVLNPRVLDFEALLDDEPEVWKEAIDGLIALASPESLEALRRANTTVHE